MSDTEPGAVERWVRSPRELHGVHIDCHSGCKAIDFARAHDVEDARRDAGLAESLTTITQLGGMIAEWDAVLKQAREALKVAHACCCCFGTPCTPKNCVIQATLAAIDAL